MKKNSILLVVLWSLIAVGCTSTDQKATETATQETKEAKQAVQQEKTEVETSGNYVFDAETFKEKLEAQSGMKISDMPEEAWKETVENLKGFRIEIGDQVATAYFGEIVVKGNLEKVSSDQDSVTFKMTPVDEDKKEDTVNLVVKSDGTLVLDPGKKEKDKMYFKKSV